MDALLDQYKGQKQEGQHLAGGALTNLEEVSVEVLVLFVTSQIADFTQLCVLAKSGASKKVRDGFSPLNFCVKCNLLKDVMLWYRTSIFVIMFSEAHSVANCRVAHLLWLWCRPEISNLRPLLSKHHAKTRKSTVSLGTACVHILFDILHPFVRFSTTICDFSSFM